MLHHLQAERFEAALDVDAPLPLDISGFVLLEANVELIEPRPGILLVQVVRVHAVKMASQMDASDGMAVLFRRLGALHVRIGGTLLCTVVHRMESAVIGGLLLLLLLGHLSPKTGFVLGLSF